MKHIFFNMKTYWVSVLAILILLIAQAFCDFALPNYTSDLIDTGITNNGIEYATPDEISIESYAGIATFMTEEEKDKWEASYTADGKTFVLAKGTPPMLSYPLSTREWLCRKLRPAWDLWRVPVDRGAEGVSRQRSGPVISQAKGQSLQTALPSVRLRA